MDRATISADLEALGAETFLDAKDIRTGESIDESIQKHLKESDELLMLLSPEAISSSWVLVEIGGARALDLRLIPILLHVGINDVPTPVAKNLARDLNEIEIYYREVSERIAAGRKGETPKGVVDASESTTPAAEPVFDVGDAVVILPPSAHRAERTDVGWVDGEMGAFVGRTAHVLARKPDTGSLRLDVDTGRWWWAPEWLSPAATET